MNELTNAAVETLPARAGDLDELLTRFIDSQDVSARSRATYRRSLNAFRRWIEAEGISTIDRSVILAYKRSLQARGLSAFTVGNYLTPVRRLFPTLSADIKGGKKPQGNMRDALTVAQTVKLLRSIDRSTLAGARDYALINLLVNCGLRTIEVTRADVGDIRQEGGEAVLFVRGKGRDSKDEPVVLTDATLAPLHAYLGRRTNLDNSAALFASVGPRNRGGRLTTRAVSRIVKQRLKAIGVNSPRITAHSLRNTALTLYVSENGGDLLGAQTLARHADPRTTQKYVARVNRTGPAAPERRISETLQRAGAYAS